MKRSLFLAALVLVSLSSSAWAGGVGAVRVPFDPEVGWANINTTADGKLVITAHVDAGRPNQEFNVSVRVRYEDGNNETFQDIAVLSTNAQGKGNVNVHVDTSPPGGSSTLRRVAVRVRRAPQPLYVAIAWDVPLKPRPRF